MRLRGVLQVAIVLAAGALALGCTAEVDRQAAPRPSGVTTAPNSVAPTTGAAGPTATSVPGTEMTPPADRNVCGRVRTATNDYSKSYDNAAQPDKATIGKKWAGFVRDRAAEARDPKLRTDLTKVADEVASWRPGQPDLRAYISLLNSACARWGV
jgi:hypothetical protein